LQKGKRIIQLSMTLGVVLIFSAAFKLFNKKETSYKPLVSNACQEASYFLGLRVDTLVLKEYRAKKGESFKSVLQKNGLDNKSFESVRKASRQIINLNYSISGLGCTLIKNTDGELRYAVLERSPINYVILDINGEASTAYTYDKEAVYQDREVVGIVNGDLYTTFKELDIPRNLIYQIDKVYDYTFNLYKLRNGDTIRISYEEMLVDGVVKKATQLKACILTNKGNRYYAISYKIPGEKAPDFYDEHGNALKRSFLEKPLKYGRVSSKFNKNRLHPVLKVTKAHLGTDFAAPHGTPIIATADGVVQEAASSKYNGNYIKIKHNNTYTTQYLHMSRFAKGMRKGVKVKQGEVIGYVGSTGLATGPHVCYRFWKNGQQVDPFRENLRFAKAMDTTNRGAYLRHVSALNKTLLSIQPWNHHNYLKDAVASVAASR